MKRDWKPAGMKTTGRTTLSDGRWINWQSDGSGETVLLHGITEDLHAWDTFVPELSRTSSVVRMDLPGHGDSSPLPHYWVLSFASAVVDFIAAAHLESPRLIGHSLGGFVATVVASMCPVRSVVRVHQSLLRGSCWQRTAKLMHGLLYTRRSGASSGG